MMLALGNTIEPTIGAGLAPDHVCISLPQNRSATRPLRATSRIIHLRRRNTPVLSSIAESTKGRQESLVKRRLPEGN